MDKSRKMSNYYTYLLGLTLLFCAQCLTAQISINSNQVVFENIAMRQVVSFKNATIKPLSIFDKKGGKELLVADHAAPWFEFVVNQQLITANDPIWKYKSNSIRKLNNGGQEIELLFESTRKLNGLQIKIYRQIFPNSFLVRERLVLSADGKDIQLDKKNGSLHFRFPVYTLKQNFSNTIVEEIRIATFAKEGMEGFNTGNTWDDRLLDGVKTFNLANCHMFHPDRKKYPLKSQQMNLMKGPFVLIHSPAGIWFTAYEHASQDKNWKAEQTIKPHALNNISIDEQQGVSGDKQQNSDSVFWFLGVGVQGGNKSTELAHQVLRGAYLEGENFGKQHPYETVWTATGFASDTVLLQQEMHQYLWSYITEHPASRKSHFYYNTWGMQRDNTNTTGLREIYTEQRILTEINNAAELKVDLFVLDDGWEETMGDWQANKKRLPNGLKPLIDAMKQRGIIPGIWLSPMGIDSLADRFKQNQQWVIKEENGKPIKGQWDFPVFDFVSDFNNLFVADCKLLVDQGIRFFKWDAINTFNSTLAKLHHGNGKYSPEDIRDRYAYLLPFYVTEAMRALREYNPEVVVEIDVTEKERCMVGLIILQEGKFFWMNNGASGYNDYGTYRT
ncbi:MAG: alpha-galactosidase, partial [Ferruginibacter sp.]|nr:alpha-galactosidase [Ferruginibacter sp.]